jgi:hypothetical protein
VGKEWDNGILGKKGKKQKEKDFEKETKMTYEEKVINMQVGGYLNINVPWE